MSPYVDTDTGEVYEGCPHCETTREQAEAQVQLMERERRADRTARAKAEKAVDRDIVAKRDGKLWKELLAYWCAAFPEKKITSKEIKSARATRVFQRLEAGATPEDVRHAINAVKSVPYVVYGRRVKSGSRADLAVDLEDVVSVGHDARFDELVELGREMDKEAPW